MGKLLEGKKIGLGITGSFCTVNEVKGIIESLIEEGADVYPFVTDNVLNTDTRFRKASELIEEIETITGKKVVSTTVEAEKFGPYTPLDMMVVLPITGNSIAKLANGINDSAPLMATKTTLRNLRPVVLGVFTNDALGMSGVNIMKLINTKNIFFVPFGQDDPIKKPNSMTSNLSMTVGTVVKAFEGKQIQPVIIENFNKNSSLKSGFQRV